MNNSALTAALQLSPIQALLCGGPLGQWRVPERSVSAISGRCCNHAGLLVSLLIPLLRTILPCVLNVYTGTERHGALGEESECGRGETGVRVGVGVGVGWWRKG